MTGDWEHPDDEPIEPEVELDTYQSIAAAYRDDRFVMDTTHPPAADTKHCRYCGAGWQHYPNSQFDGHVRCMVSLPFQRRLVHFIDQHPSSTYHSVALALGVTYSVVKAWWANIKMPRRHPASSEPSPENPEV